MPRFLCLALVLTALSPTVALAHRVAPGQTTARGGAAPRGDVDDLLADETRTSSGRARIARVPVPAITSVDVRLALQGTRPELERCLADAGLTGSLRVTARIAVSHSLSVSIVAPRHDAGVSQCAELVVRRALTQLAAEPLARAVSSSLTVRRRAPRPPRVPPPAPPPTGDLAAFEGPVHAAIEHDRAAMLSCLSGAAPGVVGDASLRLTLLPDGSLSLTSASLPTGVPAGPALPCMSARVSQMRFSPAPPRAMTIEHTLPLGL
jgi:hypothetical protein